IHDVIQWRFGQQKSLIAEIDRTAGIFNTFRRRLWLDNQTGSLTITNTRTTDDGLYEVEISSIVSADAVKPVSVLEGDSVTLRTGLTDIHDVIQWRFGQQKSPILDCLTGSLTINNIGTRHSGLYKADISSSKHTIHKTFNVTVRDAVKSELVTKGKTVTLQTNVTEIQKDDQILWMFGEIVIAEINKAAQRFNKGRLKLNNQTGSLTITNAKTTDSGLYELKISSSRHIILRRITVTSNWVPLNSIPLYKFHCEVV
uniref:Immunoglobulin domain-containing protein n=1 Tax=Sinocyclocheilus rhinocerous TaxID=307959 RepID=A0A673JUN3_9TELE